MADQLSFFAAQATPDALDMLRGELKRLSDMVQELSEEIADLTARLVPVWRREELIKQAVNDTHHQVNGVVTFNPERAAERRPLFEEWIDISINYGGIKSRRKDAVSLRNSYERDMVRIEKELKMKLKRKGRPYAKA